MRALEVPFHLAQQGLQSFRRQNLVGERAKDQLVHLRHGHGWRAAGLRVLADPGIALVVPIPATLARCRCHTRAAVVALQQAGQKRRCAGDPCRRHGWRSGMPLLCDVQKYLLINDGRYPKQRIGTIYPNQRRSHHNWRGIVEIFQTATKNSCIIRPSRGCQFEQKRKSARATIVEVH